MENGYMAHDIYIDGYYVNSNGEWVPNPSVAVTSTQNELNISDSKNDLTTIGSSINENVEDTFDVVNNDKNDKTEENSDDIDNEDIDEEDDIDDEENNDDFYDYSRKNLSEEYVSGYRRKNGTYVHGYWRTKRDGTTSNNYTYRGNTNPHNGKKGYRR